MESPTKVLETNIIFLDLDGVLNNRQINFDFNCCQNLRKIVDATKAKIVLSSSWRFAISSSKILIIFYRLFKGSREKVNEELKLHGMDPIIGWTPSLGWNRVNEISFRSIEPPHYLQWYVWLHI
jgi:hypothetical protein